jgi:hypothetical protein
VWGPRSDLALLKHLANARPFPLLFPFLIPENDLLV